MDPVANLLEQRSLAQSIAEQADENAYDISSVDVIRLVELVQALDEWRRSGGFDPYLAQPEILR